MCYSSGHPRPVFHSSGKISDLPDYQKNGKHSHGLLPTQNPRAELCADCGKPRGKHLVYPSTKDLLCPDK